MVGQKKVCPEKINPYIIAGPLAGAILLTGILLLVGWKIAVSLYDRQQVRQFEEEIRSADWQKTGTPVSRPVSVRYRNPNYRLSKRRSNIKKDNYLSE